MLALAWMRGGFHSNSGWVAPPLPQDAREWSDKVMIKHDRYGWLRGKKRLKRLDECCANSVQNCANVCCISTLQLIWVELINSTEVFDEAFTTIQVWIGIQNRKQNRSLGIEFWVAGINSKSRDCPENPSWPTRRHAGLRSSRHPLRIFFCIHYSTQYSSRIRVPGSFTVCI